jgi:glycosyltransferase involved in cell wall biosynthesis
MRLLYVTHEIPWPPEKGGQIRLWNVFQALQGCGTLDVVVFQPRDRPVADEVYRSCRKVLTLSADWLRFTPEQERMYYSTLGRSRLVASTFKPLGCVGPPTGQLARWFDSLVQEGDYDVIWISRTVMAVALDWRDPRRTILDGGDYDCVLQYHILRSTSWYGAKVLNYLDILKLFWLERQLPRWYARVARCSEEDRQRMACRNVVVVPNGTDIAECLPRSPTQRVVFLGSLGFEPNRIGTEWFIRHVWPRVRASVPAAQLDIIGGQPSPWLLAQHGCEGISVHGFVKDLRPHWQGAALSIAPLLAGSGTRLKILESLAQTVPVVSTSIGAYGLLLGAEDGVVRADRPEDFASCTAKMLQQPLNFLALAEKGRSSVIARYSWEGIRRDIKLLVQDVARGHSSLPSPLRRLNGDHKELVSRAVP